MALELWPNWVYCIGPCDQSYKASTIVIYDSRVISINNLLVITTLES